MPQPKISLVQSTANSNSLNAAIAFSEAGLLHELITTLAYNPTGNLANILKVLPQKFKNFADKELKRRTWTITGSGRISSYMKEELIRLFLTKTNSFSYLGLNRRELIDWVCASLDSQVAQKHLGNINAVYAYEDGAANTFTAAKKQGILCFYELPILFHLASNKIQAQEAELFPDLAGALQAIDEPVHKIERKQQEIQLADRIFVPSSVVKDSLLSAGVAAEKIAVIPYGAPVDYFQPQPKTDNTFRVISIGRLSPRKGIHYLLKAWQELKLPQAELLFVGKNLFPDRWLDSYSNCFTHIPSVPHHTLNQYYSSGSVLVLPSLVEGLSLVQLEAMACGIPIITTHNAGGTDIITDGVEGFIVPIRDTQALKEKIEWCYEHPHELAEMGKAARKKAEYLTWDLYRQRLANEVESSLNHRHASTVGS